MNEFGGGRGGEVLSNATFHEEQKERVVRRKKRSSGRRLNILKIFLNVERLVEG